ncbi:MAG: hypothetical protein ACU0BN_07595 [Sulfitobacter sp.]
MSTVYGSLSRAKKIEMVEEALVYVGTMVEQRTDGDAYLGVYECLEQELDELKVRGDIKSRIRRRLEANSFNRAA